VKRPAPRSAGSAESPGTAARPRPGHGVPAPENARAERRAASPRPAVRKDRALVAEARSRISVIGTGYLGATHAACMAELGFEVIGLDVDPAKVAELSAGRVPFYEPGLEEVLTRNLASGRLR